MSETRLRKDPDSGGSASRILIAGSELPAGLLPARGGSFGEMIVADTVRLSGTRGQEPVTIQKNRLQEEDSSPEIIIQELENLEIVYQEYLIVSGRINGEFENFRINGRTKIQEGKDVRFSFKEKLELDKANVIRLEVSDANGNRCERCKKIFKVIRHPSPEEVREFRAITTLYPPAKDGGDGEITEGATGGFATEIAE